MHQSLRLHCQTAALVGNYRALQALSNVQVGAALKADAYGLGAVAVAERLLDAGCRDFFVSTWWEAAALRTLPEGSLAVLHGVGAEDEVIPGVRPVLISVEQVARWKAGPTPTAPVDVMVDTGMNRLGLSLDEVGSLAGLSIHTVHSHLACADVDHPLNRLQLERFSDIRALVSAQRYSLANSAGVFLGKEYAFDLVRPGLALYGGIPRHEARGQIGPVFELEAQVLQSRKVGAGESVGYNATFVAEQDLTVAILNLGYADGYWRAFSSRGMARFEGQNLPVIGRVSMDLLAIDASGVPTLGEGDWVTLDFNLEAAARLTGYSQYELLTGLGRRLQRTWS